MTRSDGVLVARSVEVSTNRNFFPGCSRFLTLPVEGPWQCLLVVGVGIYHCLCHCLLCCGQYFRSSRVLNQLIVGILSLHRIVPVGDNGRCNGRWRRGTWRMPTTVTLGVSSGRGRRALFVSISDYPARQNVLIKFGRFDVQGGGGSLGRSTITFAVPVGHIVLNVLFNRVVSVLINIFIYFGIVNIIYTY